uniref:hypothetical protein n=1 Tax=Bartonella sp. CL48QHWL TaxID=3243535 RepID=UPI0035CF8CCD
LPFYLTKLFLRTNLVDTSKTLLNNTPSDILCILPVYDGDQVKFKTYEPYFNKKIDRSTNYIKFSITDEKGKIVNFRGTKVTLELMFEVCSESKT